MLLPSFQEQTTKEPKPIPDIIVLSELRKRESWVVEIIDRPARSALFGFYSLASQVVCDLTELFEGGFEVIDDSLAEDIRIGKIVGLFEALVSEPEDVEAGLVAVRSELEESE
ncbi:MAG: hypothetical protein A2038_09920 [Deltaproteobacteria bacterium GWA2_57_13]|nr:MAG: hypothetical protein A2038_09920 [Deltaproteobacteria bacterium GWA2_57_13]OGQ48882.1 MAG: hypothetical protein A3I10_02910 [Deltaproteobacteria bacterium RIFCSPLOWO2_02_FULL_57_26]OGQ75093.1 MAG: hypothetical protein A3G40_12890 [Deltaproteobacteria bacterium RIFCSPLOWO2_12_FULL_57_22]